MVRVPGCKRQYFHKSKAFDALICRDNLCRSVGIDPYTLTDLRAGRRLSKPRKDKNSELPPGVFMTKDKKTMVDGSVKTYHRLVAYGLPGSKQKTKCFDLNKLGLKQAIAMAIAWREQSQLTK